MKRLFITLFIGLALVACSSTNTDTTNQNTTPQNETNNNAPTNNGTNNNASTNNGTNARLSYLEGLGYSNISNVNDTKYYQTYLP